MLSASILEVDQKSSGCISPAENKRIAHYEGELMKRKLHVRIRPDNHMISKSFGAKVQQKSIDYEL